MKVVSSNNNSRGKIIGIDDYGAGTVVEIKWQNEKMPEVLPFTEDYFKEINVEKGYIIVERPEYF